MAEDLIIETKDNRDWLRIARDSFNNSTSYIDSFYKSQWEDNIRMFNNQHPKGSKYNSELYSKRSNIFRPKTRSAGIKFEAAAATAYFSTTDSVNLQAGDENDIVQRASAMAHEHILNTRIKRKDIPWFKLVCGAAQDGWKMGNVCSCQEWEYIKNDKGKVISDRPVVRLVPLENIRFDQSSDWADPVKTSPFIIEMIPMYAKDVADEWGIDIRDALAAQAKALDSVKSERENKDHDPNTESQPIDEFKIVWVHRNIVNIDDEDMVYYTLETEELLDEPRPLKDDFKHGRPYVLGSVILEPHKVLNSGQPELGQGIQEEINDVANLRLDNVKHVIHKRYFAKRGRQIDVRSLLRNVAGSITVMDNPFEDIQVVSTPDVTSSAYAEQDRLNVDYDELIGNFSTSSVSTNRSLGQTVGGLGLLASGAGQITEFNIRVFNETWTEPVIQQVVEMIKHYENDKKLIEEATSSLINELAQMDPPILMKPRELLKQNVISNLNVGITATNPTVKLEKFMMAVNSLGQIMQSPVAQLGDLKEIVKEVFGLLGYKDGARFFSALKNGEDPRIVALQQQVQELSQIIQNKQVEKEADMKIEVGKLQLDAQKQMVDQQDKLSEINERQAKVDKTNAETQKLLVEIQKLVNDPTALLENRKLDIEAAKVQLENAKSVRDDKTIRDKILAEWKQLREELTAKKEITKLNQGQKPSNNITDRVDQAKEKNE